jgi:hypothetical protein
MNDATGKKRKKPKEQSKSLELSPEGLGEVLGGGGGGDDGAVVAVLEQGREQRAAHAVAAVRERDDPRLTAPLALVLATSQRATATNPRSSSRGVVALVLE